MRIACIADTHLAPVGLPCADVLVHAGDLTANGTLEQWASALHLIEKDIENKGYRKVIIVAGNHDWLLQLSPSIGRVMVEERGFTYLQDEGITFEGIKFWGSPWTPNFNNWAFNLDRMDMELHNKWELIPPDTDILITHGPPQGILDATPTQGHVGCYDLLQRIKTIRPKAHIFGHIHYAYGVQELDETLFVNASIMAGDLLNNDNKPIILDYVDGNVDVALPEI